MTEFEIPQERWVTLNIAASNPSVGQASRMLLRVAQCSIQLVISIEADTAKNICKDGSLGMDPTRGVEFDSS